MAENDITQIRVNNSTIGIVGLEAVMADLAGGYAARSDGEIGTEMLRRLETKNYIPAKARSHYAEALVREFRKYLGQPVIVEGERTDADLLVQKIGAPSCLIHFDQKFDLHGTHDGHIAAEGA